MSTRGWYEYYVIDPTKGTLSLAMQFYKWGDATPQHALCEYTFFRNQLAEADGVLPIDWLDGLLREQLGDLHPGLPDTFATGAFLFLLQRAAELKHRERFLRWQPLEEWPEYHLRFALEEALAREPLDIQPHPDPHLERVRWFIAIARRFRPWRDYGLRLDVLSWLQYLTQPTRAADMGSLAGDFERAWDSSYRYRFFFWQDNQHDPVRIERMAIELCDREGEDLLARLKAGPESDTESDEWKRREAEELEQSIRKEAILTASLATLQQQYPLVADDFWQFRERPDPESTRQRARKQSFQPACNMLLRQVRQRFGAEVAEQSRPLFERIDDFESILALCDPVLDSADGEAWLQALRNTASAFRAHTPDRQQPDHDPDS